MVDGRSLNCQVCVFITLVLKVRSRTYHLALCMGTGCTVHGLRVHGACTPVHGACNVHSVPVPCVQCTSTVHKHSALHCGLRVHGHCGR